MSEPGLSPEAVRDVATILKLGVALGLIVLTLVAVQIVAQRWLKPAWMWRAGREKGRENTSGQPRLAQKGNHDE